MNIYDVAMAAISTCWILRVAVRRMDLTIRILLFTGFFYFLAKAIHNSPEQAKVASLTAVIVTFMMVRKDDPDT